MHLLGSGPITEAIYFKVCQLYPTHIYSEVRQSSPKGAEYSKYEDIFDRKIGKEDVIILGWRKVPIPSSLKSDVMRFLAESTGKNNLVMSLSSVAVYGETHGIASEWTKVNPKNNYGKEKLFLEDTLNSIFNSKVCHLRISNVFGNSEFNDFINLVVSSVKDNRPLVLFNQGKILRDFISIQRVTEAIEIIMTKRIKIPLRAIFNVSSGISLETNKIIGFTETILNDKISKIIEPLPVNMIAESIISNAKIKEDFQIEFGSNEDEIFNFLRNQLE